MRLLESRAWEHYLGQSPNSSRRRRLIIYHWKNEKVIDVNRPFLAFLDLSRDYGFVRPENHIRSALVIVLVGGLAQVYAIDIGRAMGSWAIYLARENSVLTTLSGLGVGTAIYGIRNGWPLIRDIVAWCKISFLAVERKYLKSKRH